MQAARNYAISFMEREGGGYLLPGFKDEIWWHELFQIGYRMNTKRIQQLSLHFSNAYNNLDLILIKKLLPKNTRRCLNRSTKLLKINPMNLV